AIPSVGRTTVPSSSTLAPGRRQCKTDRSFCYPRDMSTSTRPAPTARRSAAGGRRGAAGARRSAARERLLATASRLFYREGIRAVGVERILAEAPATRATSYRHFPSKEDLVLAYLRGADDEVRAAVRTAVEAASSPADAVRAIGRLVTDDLARPEFRGCAFLKAAAEYPDPDDPVRRLVAEHRAWYVATLAK